MNTPLVDTNDILDFIRSRIVGTIVKADVYFGSFVKVDIVNLHGQALYLRLLYCDWKVDKDGVCLEQAGTCGRGELACLNGRSIAGIEFQDSGAVDVLMDDGARLAIVPDLREYETGDELLCIVIEDQYFEFFPGFRVSITRS